MFLVSAFFCTVKTQASIHNTHTHKGDTAAGGPPKTARVLCEGRVSTRATTPRRVSTSAESRRKRRAGHATPPRLSSLRLPQLAHFCSAPPHATQSVTRRRRTPFLTHPMRLATPFLLLAAAASLAAAQPAGSSTSNNATSSSDACTVDLAPGACVTVALGTGGAGAHAVSLVAGVSPCTPETIE